MVSLCVASRKIIESGQMGTKNPQNANPYLFHNFTEKISNMTTIVINEKTKKGRIILDLIREMGVGEIIESKKASSHIPNDTTMKAIRDADEGKTIKCTDFDDYLNKVK
jgi:hypothetical protein